MAWRLNERISNVVEMLEAYKLVMRYLTATQVSPMEVAFVENSDPLATSVSADTLDVKVPSLLIEFENIPVDRIEEVIPKMSPWIHLLSTGSTRWDKPKPALVVTRKLIGCVELQCV